MHKANSEAAVSQSESPGMHVNSSSSYREKLIQHALGQLNLAPTGANNLDSESAEDSLAMLGSLNQGDGTKVDVNNPSIHNDIMKQSELVLTNLLLSGEGLDPTFMLNLSNWQSVHKSIADELAEETKRRVQEELDKRRASQKDSGTSPTRPKSSISIQNEKSLLKSPKESRKRLKQDKELRELLSRIKSGLKTNDVTVVDSPESNDTDSVDSASDEINASQVMSKDKDDSLSVEVEKRKKRLDVMLEAFTGKRAQTLKDSVRRPVEPEFMPQPEPQIRQESPTTVRRRKVQSVLDRYGLKGTGLRQYDHDYGYKPTKSVLSPASHSNMYKPYQSAVLSFKHNKENICENSLDYDEPQEQSVRSSPIMARIKAGLKEKVESFSDSSSMLGSPVTPVRKSRHDGDNAVLGSRTSSSLIRRYYTKPRREVYPHKSGYTPCYNTVDANQDEGLQDTISFEYELKPEYDIREPSSQESFIGGTFRTSSPVTAAESSYLGVDGIHQASTLFQEKKYNTRHDERIHVFQKAIPHSDIAETCSSRHSGNQNNYRENLNESVTDLMDFKSSSEKYFRPKDSPLKVTFRDRPSVLYPSIKQHSSETHNSRVTLEKKVGEDSISSMWKGMVDNNFNVFSDNHSSYKGYRYTNYDTLDNNSKYDKYESVLTNCDQKRCFDRDCSKRIDDYETCRTNKYSREITENADSLGAYNRDRFQERPYGAHSYKNSREKLGCKMDYRDDCEAMRNDSQRNHDKCVEDRSTLKEKKIPLCDRCPDTKGSNNDTAVGRRHLEDRIQTGKSEQVYQRKFSTESIGSDKSDVTSASSVDLVVTKSGDIWHRKKHSDEIKLRSPDSSFGQLRRVYQEGDSLREIDSFMEFSGSQKKEETCSKPYTDESKPPNKSLTDTCLEATERGINISEKIDKTLKEYEGLFRKNTVKEKNNKDTDNFQNITKHEHLTSRFGNPSSEKETSRKQMENKDIKAEKQTKQNGSHFSAARIFTRLKKNREAYNTDSLSSDMNLQTVTPEKYYMKVSSGKATDNTKENEVDRNSAEKFNETSCIGVKEDSRVCPSQPNKEHSLAQSE